MTDVAVLRTKIHGMTAHEYAEALRERLPDRTVVDASTPGSEREALAEARVATGFRVDPEDVGDALDLFACVFAGTGHLDVDGLADRGVAVTNASGVHGPNVSEHAIGAVLSFVRRFHVARRRQESRTWRSFRAHELQDSTVTVVGMGAIGTAVLERLAPFGVERIGVRHSPEKGGPADEIVDLTDDEAVHGALARTDYLVLACPLTDETRHLVDGEALRTIPSEAVIVNVARGAVVDTDALLSALRSNAVRGAALDVTDPEPLPQDHPLWSFDNVLITPHNAGHTPAYWERLADIVAENVRRLDGGGELENRVV